MTSPFKTDLYTNFTNRWNAEAPLIASPVGLYYSGLIYSDSPGRNSYWCRLSTVAMPTEQASLAGSVGAPGVKRYTVQGIVYAQIFAPRHLPGSLDKAEALAEIASKVFRKQTYASNIWYRGITVEEHKYEEQWLSIKVSARYSYSEFQ